MRLCPLAAISQELVRFDLQAMETPEIAGIAYQQGTLAGYEAREYLLRSGVGSVATVEQLTSPYKSSISSAEPRVGQIGLLICVSPVNPAI